MQQMGTFNGQPNQAPPQNQPTSSTIIREGHYGNGQYRIVMNQTTATIPIIRNGPQGNPQIQPMNNAAGNAVPSLPSFPALLSTLPVPVPPPSTVYLLSSPTGPQAIVMAPGGTYTTPGLGQFGQGAPQLPFRQPNYDYIAELRARVEQLSRNRPNVQAPLQANGQVPQPQNNPALENPAANPQDEQRDQVNDLIQLLIPLGTHLWLFIRLFGFVYLFAGGAAWSRTIMLGVGAAVIFLAQTGMFQPFQEAVWHPIRRHIEGIVQNDIDGRADYPVRVGGRAQGPTNPADPQQLADRMIRERQERDTNVILSTIRRAERSIVLLIASLVPGVGERHIAARDAAEAAARQEREREEQARQELEERARQSNEATQGSPSDANTAAENALD